MENKKTWVYGIALLFIITNAILVYFEFFYLGLIPVFLLIGLVAFFRLDNFLFLIVFLTPASIPIRKLVRGLENDLYLPTEPLLAFVLLIFIMKLIQENKFDKKVAYHPVSIVIYLNLFWILVTSVTSTMPLVSFKFLVSRLWFLVAFYFIATQIFKKYKNIYRYFWFYLIPFLGVIGYAIFRHIQHGLANQRAAHFVSSPFFNDHTAYGASLAMVFPVLIGFIFMKSKNLITRIIASFLVLLFIGAIVLSYTRAAWLSLFGALGVFIIIILRIRFKHLLLMAAVIAIVIASSWTRIMIKLEKNRSDSSDYLAEHVQSMSNVSTDASNLERINRWSCALRMFKDKPLFGWGPGTYKFEYAPYQLSYQKTIISTNAGVRGNAHSEYIGPLSESGFLGMVTFMLIVIVAIITGVRVYFKVQDKDLRIYALCIFLGLITYIIHGFLNNFLDTDKASALFWGYIAMLVTIDLYHTGKNPGEIKEENQ